MEPFNSKFHTIITESNRRWKQNSSSLEKSHSKDGSVEVIPEEGGGDVDSPNVKKEVSIVELDSN